MTPKTCFKCHETKDIGEFYKHPRMGDGHLGKCKECTKRDSKKRYYDKHDDVMAYEHKRLDDPDRRAKALASARLRAEKQRESHRAACRQSHMRRPSHKRANALVRRAILCGKLARQCCSVCGAANAQAHHPDYSKPLEVVWLCSYHHGVAHRDSRYRRREEAA